MIAYTVQIAKYPCSVSLCEYINNVMHCIYYSIINICNVYSGFYSCICQGNLSLNDQTDISIKI